MLRDIGAKLYRQSLSVMEHELALAPPAAARVRKPQSQGKPRRHGRGCNNAATGARACQAWGPGRQAILQRQARIAWKIVGRASWRRMENRDRASRFLCTQGRNGGTTRQEPRGDVKGSLSLRLKPRSFQNLRIRRPMKFSSGSTDRIEITAVLRIVAIIAHHEIVAGRQYLGIGFAIGR